MNQPYPQFKDAPQIDRINLAHAIIESALDKLDNLGLTVKNRCQTLRKDNITIEPKPNYKRRAIS